MSDLPSIRQLEYLVAVARTGNIGRAARELHVTQPAVSRQLQELEDSLGTLLFERTSRGMKLTGSGELVLQRAERILRETRELVAEAHMLGGEPRGTLRIGAIPTAAPYLLDGLLRRLRERHPGIRFELNELRTEFLVQSIEEGSTDVGLLALPLDNDSLIVEPILREPFVFVAEKGHRLLQQAPVFADMLSDTNLLLLEDGHCFRDQAIDVCLDAGARADTTIEAASIGTLVRLVEAGLGSTLLPLSAVSRELYDSEGLGWSSFASPAPGRVMGLCWRASSPRHGLMRQLGEMCRDHVASLQRRVPEPTVGDAPSFEVLRE